MHIDAESIARTAVLVTPDELAIVSGAGVSLEHPTHSPLGWELMAQAMESYFLPGTLADLEAAYEAMKIVTKLPDEFFEGRPRLEAVLDVVNRTHGPVALGHESLTLTVDLYSHWMGHDADDAAILRIDAVLGDAGGTPAPNLRAID